MTFSKYRIVAFYVLSFISCIGLNAQKLVHNFEFNSNLNDSKATGISLTEFNIASSSFGTNPNSWTWSQNSSPGGGLVLLTDRLPNPEDYSLGFRIKFDDTGNANGTSKSYKKILTFKGQTSDNGLYFNHRNLQFFPFGANASITYVPNTFYDFVLTRSNNRILVYIVESDGTVTKVYDEADASDHSVPHEVNGKREFRFFMNDNTATEHTTGGTVRGIRMWDAALSPQEIAGALSSVTTSAATKISAGAATLNGTANPQGTSATFGFEYGTTQALGQKVTGQPASGSGSAEIDVQADISGLTSSTTYYYRLNSTNVSGTSSGSIQSFTTGAAPGGITGAALWLDASDVDADGATDDNPTDGTPVTTWADKSGNDNDLTVPGVKDGVGINPPSYLNDQFNGASALRFTSSNKEALGTILSSQYTGDFTLFIVLEGTATNPEDFQSFFSAEGFPQSNVGRTTDGWQIAYTEATNRFSVRGEESTTAPIFVDFGEANNNLNLFAVARSGSDLSTYSDGVLQNTLSTSGATGFQSYRVGTNRSAGFFYDSKIAEVIIYHKSLDACELESVQNYLGNKYGRDYNNLTSNFGFSSDFSGDISGIGAFASACSGNITTNSATSDIITIDNPSDNTVAGRFLTFAHDGAAYSDSQDVPSAFSNRLGRVWRVDVDGLTGTVDLTFDLSGLNLSGSTADEFALIVSSSATLASGSLNRNGIYDAPTQTLKFSALTLSNGDYISLAKDPVGPGGVFGANLWLRADRGLVAPSNTLTQWQDQEGFNTFVVKNLLNSLVPLGVNFNPSVKFNGINDYLQGSSSIKFQTVYAVYKRDEDSNSGTVIGVDPAVASFSGLMLTGRNLFTSSNAQGGAATAFRSAGSLGTERARIAITQIDPGANPSDQFTAIDGKIFASQGLFGTSFQPFSGVPIIGSTLTTGGGSYFDGQLSELIMFPNEHLPEERLKVQSYLAVKYGITLDPSVTNYVASDGTIIWNDQTFWNDVFGIGKDDKSRLQQSRSNSINTGSGSGRGQSGKANIVLKNPSSLDEGDYLMMGNDGSRLELAKSSVLNGFGQLKRLWKVDKTGDPGLVDIEFDISGLPVFGVDAANYKLLIDQDGDGDFSTGTVDRIDARRLSSNVLHFGSLNFNDGAVFTLADELPNAANSLNANRIIVNPSFETGGGIPHTDVAYLESLVGDAPKIDGWYSTHPTYQNAEGAIEHWRSGFNGVPSQDGSYFVELNVSQSSRLFQHVYLVNGESVDWRYFHRQRTSGATEELRFSVYDDAGNSVIKTIDTHRASSTSNWQERTGTFTWNQPTGFYQIGFESTTGGGSGNFLDNITIGLQAFTEFAQDTIRLTEGQSIAPYIYVNGQVQRASSFTIQVDGGGAVEGTDYRFTNKTVDIPIGDYALADSLALNFEIIDNNLPQNERIIELSISRTSGDVDERDANSDGIYQRDLVVIIQDDDPCKSAGINTIYSLCASNGTSLDFLSLLDGNPDSGGSWIDPANSGIDLSDAQNVDVSALAVGVYQYAYLQAANGICPEEIATLTLVIRDPFPMGENNSATVCNDGSTLNLMSALAGTPKAGGVWTTSSGADLSDPTAVNFTGINAGSYSFVYTTSTGDLNCAGSLASAELTINVKEAANAGTSNTANVCDGGPSTVLNFTTLIGPADKGVWTETTSSGLDPNASPTAVDFDGIAAGKYIFNYTVTGNSPCGDAVSTLTVNVSQDHNPGTNGAVSVCNDNGTVDLTTALGSHDAGGSWNNDDNLTGISLSDPSSVDFSNVAAGTYDFTYSITGVGVCNTVSATITVSVIQAANAGLNSTVNVCDGGSSTVLNLFTSLSNNPDAGGSWSETSVLPSGVNLSDPTNVDFNGVPAGKYEFTYTVNGTSPCGNVSSTLTVNVDQDHNAGTPTTIIVCNDSPPFNLFANLAGSPDAGGSWTFNAVAVTDPTAVNFSGFPAGDYVYTYTITGEGVCNDVSNTLTVTIVEEINSGIDTTLDICLDKTSSLNLFTSLAGNPDQGGDWIDLDNSGLVETNNILDLQNASDGTYRFQYIVRDPAQCTTKSSTLTLNITSVVKVGPDMNLVACTDSQTYDLMDYGTGTRPAGGSWIFRKVQGTTGDVDLSDPTNVDFSNLNFQGDSTIVQFVYAGPRSVVCNQLDAATVIVRLFKDPNAGLSNTVNVCDGGASTTLNLFGSLNGTPETGGTWQEFVQNSGDTFSGVSLTDPTNIDFNGVVAGKYFFRYTVAGRGNCADASAIITVNVNQDHDAGADASLLVCNDPITTYDLFANLGGTPEAGGAWTDDDNTGIDISNPSTVNFDGLTAGSYDFTYAIAGEGVCNTVSATLTVTVVQQANAGQGNTVSVCDGGPSTTLNLFTSLLGSPDAGGVWSEVSSSGVDLSDPTSVDFDAIPAGRYQFRYTVSGTTPCADESTDLIVNVNQVATVGTPSTIFSCADQVQVSLFTGLLGTVDQGGTWTDDDNTGVDLSDPDNVDVSSLTPGTYDFTYTVTGVGACANVSVTTQLLVNPPISAGTPTVIDVCNGTSTSVVDIFGQIAGGPTAGGTWYDTSGIGVDFTDPSSVSFVNVTPGTYAVYYQVSQQGFCSTASNLITINVNDAPDLQVVAATEVCNDSFGDLDFTSLVNLTGGTWNDNNTSGVDLSDPSNVSFENVTVGSYDFTYVLPSDGICGIVSGTMTVTVYEGLDAGIDSSAEICADGSTLDLFASLGGTPDAGGVWNNKDNATVSLADPTAVDFNNVPAGTYRFGYTVVATGNGPCTSKSSILTVTVNALPNAGNDVRVPVCVDPSGTTIDLTNYLSSTANIGGGWTDGSSSGVDLSDPTAVDISTLIAGSYNYVYTVVGQGSCANDTATITLEVSELANAGTNALVSICNDGSTLDLFGSLGQNAQSGGQWTDLNRANVDLSNSANVSFINVTPGQYKFEYTITGSGPCPDVSAIVTVQVDRKANAGLANTVSVCDGGASTTLNLFTSLGGTPDAGGSWTESTSSGANISDPLNVDFAGIAAGRYVFTYTVSGSGSCGDVSTDLIVNVNQDHNAGTNTTVEVCTSTTDFDLTTALAGNPDPGGRWLDVSGSGLNLTDPISVNLSSLSAGSYNLRYVITGEGVCNDVEAILTLTVNESVNAGSDASIDVCNGGASSLNLFALLGQNTNSGGTWTDNDGAGVTLGNGSNVSFASVAAGTYTFTYAVTSLGACSNDSATITVNVTRIPNAGTDATIELCNDGSTVDLMASLGGSQDMGGNWTEITNSNVSLSDLTAVNFEDVAAGTYQFLYIVKGSGPCADQTATVTVNLTQAANAGKSHAIVVCNGGAGTTRDLFAAIKGRPDSGGTWADVNSSGVDISDPTQVDFAGIPAGKFIYSYTVSGKNTCNDATVFITVNVDQEANAGTDSSVDLCNNVTDFDPFDYLAGNPDQGGNWIDLDKSKLNLSALPKKLSLKGLKAGTYRLMYEIPGDGICNTVNSILTLNISEGVFAGIPATLEVCNDSGVLDLQAALGVTATAGGTWSDDNSSGVDLTDATSVDFTGITAGTYQFTYTLAGDNVCPGDTNVITVEVTEAPDAGSNHNIELCNIGTYDLNSSLDASADSGGTWLQIIGPSNITPAGSIIDVEDVVAGEYRFTYTVQGTGPCSSDFSYVVITITDKPEAGISNTVSVCDGGASTTVDLFASLSGSPDAGGTWSELTNSGVDITDPTAVDFDAVSAGLYQFQYTVARTGPCQAVSSYLYVNVDQDANPGIDTSVDVCNGGSTIDLSQLLEGNADPGGTWTDLGNSGVDLTNPANVNVSSLAAGTYNFQYEIAGSGVCNAVSSTLSITLYDSVNAGVEASLQVCNDGSILDLMGAIGMNVTSGGTWTDLNGSGVDLSNTTNVSFKGIVEGNYRFKYEVASNGPCPADEAIVTVSVIDLPNAGTSATLQVCNDAVSYNLFQALGSPQAGGTWSDDSSSGIDLSNPSAVKFSSLAPGTYTYTYAVSNQGSCLQQSVLTVVVAEKVDAGLDHAIYVCSGGAGTVRNLFTSLLGIPDTGGSWSDDDNSGVDLTDPTVVEFAGLAAGIYEFTYTVDGPNACQSASATVQVHIDQVIDAGTDTTFEVCNDNTTVDLFDSISGSPNLGGTWTDNNGAGVDFTNPYSVDFSGVTAGTYTFTYSISGDGICAGAASTLTVNVNQAANAGTDFILEVCNLTGTADLDLFAALAGADAGGTWQDVNNAGVDLSDPFSVDFDRINAGIYQFKYSIDGAGNCGIVSAIVTVEVIDSPNAGTGSSGTVFNDGSTIDLTALLSNADSGGTWTDTDGSGAILTDPAAANFNGVIAGTYTFTYTLSGTSPCGDVSTALNITVQNAANAGLNTRVNFCSDQASGLNLYSLLDGNPSNTGTWNTVGFKLKTFDPSNVDLSQEKSGVYIFNYIVQNSGSIDKSSLTIELSESGNAGIGNVTAGFDITTCNNGSDPLDLFSMLGGNPDLDGIWTEVTGIDGVDLSNPFLVDFNGKTAGYYEFTYTVTSDGSCDASYATLFIEVEDGANPGNNGFVEVCNQGGQLIDLFAQLGGNPDAGGKWTDSNGSPVEDATAVNFQGLPAGVYVFTYTIEPTGSCSKPVSSKVTVEVNEQLSAGKNSSILRDFNTSKIVDLFDALEGSPDPGGDWYDDSNAGINLSNPRAVDLSSLADGTYVFRYRIEPLGSCLFVESTLTVTVNFVAQVNEDTKIVEGFSPDGDGINEYWHIENIDQFPNNKVYIYNRWGHLVFEQWGYNNSGRVFIGIANQGNVVSGNRLPSGTYFYIIDFGNETKRGFLTLVR